MKCYICKDKEGVNFCFLGYYCDTCKPPQVELDLAEISREAESMPGYDAVHQHLEILRNYARKLSK